MNQSSRDHVQGSAPILADIIPSPFSVKRRSNPAAAFAEMMSRFSTGVQEDDEMANAFASFQEHFKGVALGREDAIRLAALEEHGASELGITVGSWPSVLGPGLALMYDSVLETLRASDHPIEPGLVNARAIRLVEDSLDSALLFVGSMSVTAVELALGDPQFSGQLRQRAAEIGVAYLNDPPGPCEFCIISTEDKDGNVTSSVCGTKEGCEAIGGFIIIMLILMLLGKIWDWLTG